MSGLRHRRRRPTVLVAFFALTVLPVPAAAEWCGQLRPGMAAGLEAGGIRYSVADGVSGVEWGPELALGGSRIAGRMGYRQVVLRDVDVRTHVVRGSARVALGSVLGVGLCATLHGGGTRFATGADHGTVVAGGAGAALTRAGADGAPVSPFFEVRGLAARSSGSILDIATDATGLSLGVEAGVHARLGRVQMRASGSVDGFAAGLGVTPYPERGLRVGLAYAF
jgi:hypothetical protein